MVFKIDYDTTKLQKVLYGVIKITLPKIRHQNDVTFFLFSSLSLSKILVALLGSIYAHLQRCRI